MLTNMDKLYESVAANGPVCVGLDTEISYLPTTDTAKTAGENGVAFILDALQVVGVLLLKIRSLLFGGIRVGIHRIDLLLAVIDHLLHRLEKEFFQNSKGDEHIAEGKQRSPRVDAYKTFKARHELFLHFRQFHQNTKSSSSAITSE